MHSSAPLVAVGREGECIRDWSGRGAGYVYGAGFTAVVLVAGLITRKLPRVDAEGRSLRPAILIGPTKPFSQVPAIAPAGIPDVAHSGWHYRQFFRWAPIRCPACLLSTPLPHRGVICRVGPLGRPPASTAGELSLGYGYNFSACAQRLCFAIPTQPLAPSRMTALGLTLLYHPANHTPMRSLREDRAVNDRLSWRWLFSLVRLLRSSFRCRRRRASSSS